MNWCHKTSRVSFPKARRIWFLLGFAGGLCCFLFFLYCSSRTKTVIVQVCITHQIIGEKIHFWLRKERKSWALLPPRSLKMQFILSNTYLAQKRTKGFILQHTWLAGVCLGFPTKCLTFSMSAIFIYLLYNWLYVLPACVKQWKSKNSEQGNRYKLTLSTPRITTNTSRLTTDLVRMKWWNESQEEAEPSTPQLVPDFRWHNDVRVTALFVLLEV